MKINLAVKIGKLRLKNPVTVASGTFGYAEEFKDFLNLKELGAIVTKTITLKPRQGNPSPRICETPSGLLNSIGLENPGWEAFLDKKFPVLKKIGVPIIVSIASEGKIEEFIELSRNLDKIRGVSAIELNISCPNIRVYNRNRRQKIEDRGQKLISQDPRATYEVVKAVRKVSKKTLIAKLSPNVTDIVGIAKSAESAGADALSLINTLYGMGIDIESREPQLGNVVGGLSGPAIRPIALRIIWEVHNKVTIPIIGMGGIMDAQSGLEFFIAGATAISVGTANFINPRASMDIIKGIRKYLINNKITNIKTLTGSLKT